MDPLLVFAVIVVFWLLIWLFSPADSPSSSSRDEVRRIGDATIDTMRRTSSDFREHVDRETRNHRR
jgi:hypothetical protein